MKKAKFLVMSLVLAVLMLAAGVLFVACDEGEEEPPATHTHTWATEWSSDGESHWHACTGEGCTAIADEALHTWDEGEVTTPATYDAAGVRTYTCEVCGREREEAIAQLEHTYATEWSHDDENHWHACTDEGYEDLKADVAPHSWDEGEVTTEATYDAPGVRTYTCECGATKTEEIAQLVHTWAEEYSYSSTHHWYACVDEGYDQEPGDLEYAFLRKGEAYHVFDGGVLSEDGTYKTYTCEECGYSKTSQIVTAEGDAVALNDPAETTQNDSGNWVDDPETGGLTWSSGATQMAWTRGDVYALPVSGTEITGNIGALLSNDYIENAVRLDTNSADAEHWVFLPRINYTLYKEVSFFVATNNAPYISMEHNAGNRVAFSAFDVGGTGKITLAYDTAMQTLKVTFVQGETTQTVTVTDTDVINGNARYSFSVWAAAQYSQTHVGAITGTPLTEQEVYTIYSFDNGAECGYDGRYDIVPDVGGQGVFWHNGVYCYDETVGVYKWVAGSSSKYENGMHIETQTGAETEMSTYTIYLPLIDFTTYRNVTFKVSGNNDFQTESIGFGDKMIALGAAEVVFTLQYDEQTGNVNITLVNAAKGAQMTYTLTDADVIEGEKAFTYNVKGYWYGAIEMSPIINTFTLA